MRLYKRNCVDCAFGDMCSAQSRSECIECLVQYDTADDEMLDEYIQERRKEFHKEWFAYIKEDYE